MKSRLRGRGSKIIKKALVIKTVTIGEGGKKCSKLCDVINGRLKLKYNSSKQ